MSLPFRASLLLLAAAALVAAGCDREERHPRPKPLGETLPSGTSPDTIWPGSSGAPALDARAAVYANNAPAIARGQFLFMRMNCVGCHARGGGGMGPPLMDDEWRYGGRIDQIAASIAEGRPNGMPAWAGKLPEDQIWQLAAYVRTLSGQPSKDATPSRPDAMSGPNPGTLVPRQPVRSSDSARQ
ncbi:MAG TPA: c-type cytochrome [Sphingomicrobium sp.]|nr:c-type cytochrome [Sphingomicrobium sp.]